MEAEVEHLVKVVRGVVVRHICERHEGKFRNRVAETAGAYMIVRAQVVLERECFNIEAVGVLPSDFKHLLMLTPHLFHLVDHLLFEDWVVQLVKLTVLPAGQQVGQVSRLEIVEPERVLTLAHFVNHEEH